MFITSKYNIQDVVKVNLGEEVIFYGVVQEILITDKGLVYKVLALDQEYLIEEERIECSMLENKYD